MSKAREVARAFERAGVILPVSTWATLVYEIDNIYSKDAALSRAVAHIQRGLDIISEMSQADGTIEDNERNADA